MPYTFLSVDGGGQPAVLLDPAKDIAVLLVGREEGSRSLGSERVVRFLKETGLWERTASIHSLHPWKMEAGKKPSVPQMRLGWQRVRRELAHSTGVKRLLFLCPDTASLRVLVPGLGATLTDANGTLFSVNVGGALSGKKNAEVLPDRELVMVPTWDLYNWERNPHYIAPRMLQAVKRCLRLPRPAAPLPYWTHIPQHADLSGKIALDIETESTLTKTLKSGVVIDEDGALDPATARITDVIIQWSDTERAIISGDAEIAALFEYLTANPPAEVWMHQAFFELRMFPRSLRLALYGRVRDTFIRARGRGAISGFASLKHLATLHTRCVGNHAWHVPGEKHSFRDPKYICEDAEATWRLSKVYAESSYFIDLMEKCVVMTSDQSMLGSFIDRELLENLTRQAAKDMAEMEPLLIEKYGCHPNQVQELVQRLLAMGYELTETTEKGNLSLDDKVLEALGLQDLLDYRKLSKLNSSFVGKVESLMRKDGTLPHEQKVCGADTGRTTVSNFNWAQAPRKGPTKKLLISRFPGGKIAAVDLAQAELRTVALLSNDGAMAEWLRQKDAHRVNAANAFNVAFEAVTDDQRNAAKTVVFSLIYLAQPKSEQQKRVAEYLYAAFPKLFAYLNRSAANALRELHVVDHFGMERSLTGVMDGYKPGGGKTRAGGRKGDVRRAGANTKIQSLASHVNFLIELYVWEQLMKRGMRSLVLFSVYDSIVFDVYPGEEESLAQLVREGFQNLRNTPIWTLPLSHTLPFEGEFQLGDNWMDTKAGEKLMCSSLEGYSGGE